MLEVPNLMKDLWVHIAKYIQTRISLITTIKDRENELQVSVDQTNSNNLRPR